jgi:hypothetical protein
MLSRNFKIESKRGVGRGNINMPRFEDCLLLVHPCHSKEHIVQKTPFKIKLLGGFLMVFVSRVGDASECWWLLLITTCLISILKFVTKLAILPIISSWSICFAIVILKI